MRETARSRGESASVQRPRLRISPLVRWLLIAFVVLQVGLILLFRSHSPLLLRIVRTFNKYILNPAMLTVAGRPHWYASVVRHIGRRSGRAYATPVVAEQTDHGFIIPLPYGTDVDWLRNVLAAGQFVVEKDGVTCTVGEPVLIERSEAQAFLSPSRRFAFGLYGVKEYLKVTTLSSAPVAPEQE
jgi:hypothetical protein